MTRLLAICGCGKHRLKPFDVGPGVDARLPATPCGEAWRLTHIGDARPSDPAAEFARTITDMINGKSRA